MKRSVLILILLLVGVGLFSTPCNAYNKKPKGKNMKITSSAFKEGEMIPAQYTCDDKNISPQIEWGDVPQGTKSLALICDDPDAPAGVWVHWVVFNIPPDLKEIKENLPNDKKISNGMCQGTSDFRKTGYGGPCPPGGTHRYFFKVYALDKILELEAGSTKAQLLKAMEGHILAEGNLMGKYRRK
jgi:Raf kinase inhibitor-like YbhB/YbcL family protein